MPKLILGTIYEPKGDDGFPKGTRMEFIGGPDDDIFTDGYSMEYYGADEVIRSPNQEPLEVSEVMQRAKALTMSGYEPD